MRLVQLSDTHVLANPRSLLRGMNPYESLQKILEAIGEHQPDGLLLTGDLAHRGEARAYDNLQDLFKNFEIPVYALPGNHDDATLVRHLWPTQGVDLGEWRLLLLDSVLPTATYGEGKLTAASWQWLTAELDRHPQQPTAIALHHHPVAVGVDWLDQMGLEDRLNFGTLLDRHPQVKVVLFGHIHWAFEGRDSLRYYYGCPSTCTQVAPPGCDLETRTLFPWHQPGFRLWDWQEDGQFSTQVFRLDYFKEPPRATP